MRSETNLQGIGTTPEGTNIITLGETATVSDVQKLAESCARTHGGGIESSACFVVRGILPDVSELDGAEVGGIPIIIDGVDGATTLFIMYDPVRGAVVISP